MGKYVSTGKMAEALGCTYSTVTRYCQDGLFPGAFQTPGSHWRIPEKYFLDVQDAKEQETSDSSKPNAANAANIANIANVAAPD